MRITELSTESSSLLLDGLTKALLLASFQPRSPPYACKLLTSEAENRRSGNSTAGAAAKPAKPKSRIPG